MKAFNGMILAFMICVGISAQAQKPDTLIKKLDSLSKKSDSAQQKNTNSQAYNATTALNFPNYFILLGSDLKQAFTKPFHMKKRDWKYLGAATVVIGGVALAEKSIQHSALRWRTQSPGLRNVSKYVTNFGGNYEVYTLAAFGAYGFIFRNKKMQNTTLLATQAYITGASVESVLKFLTGRERPYIYDSTKVQASPAFHGPLYVSPRDVNGKKLYSSFPSGHTTVAFAAATVFALEYKHRPWIPIFCYSVATLIGVSRITENKHWATDVLAGAGLGYLVGRQVVNNYHRYAAVKQENKKKSLTFNLQYNYGHLMPGMVYTF
jgi:membrane-associated phospholipid phosphatase